MGDGRSPGVALGALSAPASWVMASLVFAMLWPGSDALAAELPLAMPDFASFSEEAVLAAGWLGPAVFTALYVIATVLLFPASVLTLLAGAIYGEQCNMSHPSGHTCVAHGHARWLPETPLVQPVVHTHAWLA